MSFIRVQLPKCVVYLTEDEIHEMLLQNMPIYKESLLRGKAFSRNHSLNARIQQKRG